MHLVDYGNHPSVDLEVGTRLSYLWQVHRLWMSFGDNMARDSLLATPTKATQQRRRAVLGQNDDRFAFLLPCSKKSGDIADRYLADTSRQSLNKASSSALHDSRLTPPATSDPPVPLANCWRVANACRRRSNALLAVARIGGTELMIISEAQDIQSSLWFTPRKQRSTSSGDRNAQAKSGHSRSLSHSRPPRRRSEHPRALATRCFTISSVSTVRPPPSAM